MTGGALRRLGNARDVGACRTLAKPFFPGQLAEAITGAFAIRPEPPTQQT